MLSNHPNVLGGNGPSASSDLIGDVDGPASATDNAVARFNGTTGKLIQNSAVTIDDSGNITPSGSVHGANGAVGNPSFAFASDQDTGLYRIGANNLGVTVGGVKALDISSTGVTATTTLADQGGTISAQRNGLAPRQGLVFDGTAGATVSVAAFGAADFTVGAWITPNNLAANTLIFSSISNGFSLFALSTGALLTSKRNVGDNTASSGLITAGNPAFVAYVRSATTGTYYINGVSAGTTTDSQNYPVGIGYIGQQDTGSNLFPGKLAPLAYNRALSAAEVLALYQSGAPARGDYNGVLSNVNLLTAGGPWTNYSSSFNVAFASADGSTVSGTSSTGIGYVYTPITFTAGSRYRVTGTATGVTGATLYVSTTAPILSSPQQGIGTIPLGTSAIDFSWVETTGGSRSFVVNTISAIATSFALTNLRVWKDGLLLAPDSAQAGGGLAWYDTSGNAANITLPASGVSWSLPTSGKAFSLSLASSTAGSAGAGALVVTGGLATGAASYFGGLITGPSTASFESLRLASMGFGIGTAFAGGQSEIYTSSTNPLGIGTTGNAVFRIYTNSTLACTFSAAQAATFAGAVTANGQLIAKGTATNDSAAAGYIGEYVSASLAYASRVIGVTSTAATNVTSISLTAGDWDVSGVVVQSLNVASVTVLSSGCSTTSNTFGALGNYVQMNPNFMLTSFQNFQLTPTSRISLSATTTVYLIGSATFSAGTVDLFGEIHARRVR